MANYAHEAYNPFADSVGTAGKPSKRKKKIKKKNGFKRFVAFLIVLAVCALMGYVFRASVVQLVVADGGAMGTTLPDGSIVLTRKREFTKDDANPARGDVVAISTEGGTILRRVIGLPGEKITWNGLGDVSVNGEAYRGLYVQNESYDIWDEVELATQRYYVLSDNRANTFDSRDKRIGAVPKHKIEGRVFFVLYPIEKFGTFAP